MNALGYSIMPTGAKRDLLGPDLNTLPMLAEQLAVLDAAAKADDVEAYVWAWLSISDANGGGASAFWDNDAAADEPAALLTGVHCDEQHDERRARWEALHQHHHKVDGFREELERVLLGLGRYVDNRRATRGEVFAVVRAFLATGGELLLNPRPLGSREAIEPKPDAHRFIAGDWSEAHAVAARAMFRVARRWHAQLAIERIVRRLGATTSNGWVVLKGRVA